MHGSGKLPTLVDVLSEYQKDQNYRIAFVRVAEYDRESDIIKSICTQWDVECLGNTIPQLVDAIRDAPDNQHIVVDI